MHSCRTWPRYFSALLPGRVSCFPLQQQPRGAFVKSKNVKDFTVITVSCRRTTHASAPAVRTAMALRTSLDCCQVFVANWKSRVRSVGVVKVSRCTCGIFNNKGLEEASPHTLPTSKDTLDQGVFIPFLRPGWEIKELKFFQPAHITPLKAFFLSTTVMKMAASQGFLPRRPAACTIFHLVVPTPEHYIETLQKLV